MAASKKVIVRALEPLRAEDGSHVLVGGTTEVLETTATILVNNKQAELVSARKDK